MPLWVFIVDCCTGPCAAVSVPLSLCSLFLLAMCKRVCSVALPGSCSNRGADLPVCAPLQQIIPAAVAHYPPQQRTPTRHLQLFFLSFAFFIVILIYLLSEPVIISKAEPFLGCASPVLWRQQQRMAVSPPLFFSLTE
ncbi:hypothetical protein ABB37_06752 [Leptomonas pyrrhocoris]|nr:hypothetical protein ABB37_06734 [Leptomonas pyrrhocoris]XP_015656411.1 hypothetical protein ABB37_06740 [Leptomonas pyrrhocoris]XP_015656426.1 hypothetical protein ABB37_06752 [Leptomonas pyrrhocoris]KPA77965.1 hypothetical protein ABB37_06734 [Leptomonas pyrrhocoris]KPA77972.1 hypothetical protein ABB37_06740 [Leptomonas pyrrhocoris]KPA77987.1 hypothetical protein ABB37_06752 [Leptomonas pyrrhocoris]|eukprot:XP_015656404.1 hypothetical protein ABB37_06734 [Leptomonas pyrrhocoris]